MTPSQRSTAISDYIRQELLTIPDHVISFARFMELALYHPEWGYYSTEHFHLGEHGDFTTAPEISSLFAQCLARQIQQIHQSLALPSLLELGAGTGKLAGDLLTELEHLECLPDHYYIYEISAGLRKKQQDFLQTAYPRFYSRVTWLATLPENFSGTIIANEVLDALPVHCFQIEEDNIREKCVAFDHHQFVFKLCEAASPLQEEVSALRDLYSLPNGYESEINLHVHDFIAALAHSLKKGIILFADYGYGQREYYHRERSKGTLTCFYRHQKHDNPLVMPALQDITAHVDFTRVIDKAVDNGLSLLGYTSQAAFLLACGLTELVTAAEKNLTQAEELKLHHAVKLLTLPTEMGERIKFMALGKGAELPLLGFRLQERRREL
jgi:SAM-dependent MidA family methyltransferase